MDGSNMKYQQSLAPSSCINLTEEDDEPPSMSSRTSDDAITSPSIEEPFSKQNKTGCPLFRMAFIFEARSIDSHAPDPQTGKFFPVNYPMILQTLRTPGCDLARCMEKLIRFLVPGPSCFCLKPNFSGVL